MTIVIEKSRMEETRKKCKKCGQFLYETSKDGWIHFAPKTSIVSNGSEFHVRCSHCKEEAIIKIK
ncbi:hypothetical protein [Fusobacterium ulcerans]|uniref:hypothetical protein n=2 Tax=Fusobacterium ulcerans TaxID=861 RepID=UPI00241D9E92|nr:hypothetical protein [Fusobacterium ulcerans]